MPIRTLRQAPIHYLSVLSVAGALLHSQLALAGTASDFAADVLKKVAADVIASVIKDAIKPGTQPQPQPQPQTQVVAGTSDDKSRVRNIILAISDTNSPLSERIGLYATRVDYFGAGVVGHDFILKDRERFEARWPVRNYTIRSIDEIAVAADRSYAIARYTIDYDVSRGDQSRRGVSQVALVIGTFHVQPRIHAIKEWVTRAQ